MEQLSTRRREVSRLGTLPNDVLGKITDDITPEKIFQLCDNDKDMRKICNNEYYWKGRIIKEFGISNERLNEFVNIWKPKNESNAEFLTNFFYFRNGGPKYYTYPGLNEFKNSMEQLMKLSKLSATLPNIPEINEFLNSTGRINTEKTYNQVNEEVNFRDEIAYRANILRIRRRNGTVFFELPAPQQMPPNGSSLKTYLKEIGESYTEDKLRLRLNTVQLLAKEGDVVQISNTGTYFVHGSNEPKLSKVILKLPEDTLYLPKEAEEVIRRNDIQTIDQLWKFYPRDKNNNIKFALQGLQDSNGSTVTLGSLDEPHKERTIYEDYIVIVPKRENKLETPSAPRKSRIGKRAIKPPQELIEKEEFREFKLPESGRGSLRGTPALAGVKLQGSSEGSPERIGFRDESVFGTPVASSSDIFGEVISPFGNGKTTPELFSQSSGLQDIAAQSPFETLSWPSSGSRAPIGSQFPSSNPPSGLSSGQKSLLFSND